MKARAAWFSELAYHHHEDLADLRREKGLYEFECFEDGSGTSAVFAFIFEGRAWLVFRGTNDLNDMARDISFLPFWHFGFRLCFSEIPGKLDDWVERAAAQDYRFCIAGHSLGGALAMLAAEKLAGDGRPIEMVCTFGCPRVFAPAQAAAFDGLPANLPGRPCLCLKQVTYRIVDRYEAVSHVPFALFGFRHVGVQDEYGPLEGPVVTREAAAARGLRDDLAAAFRETLKGALIGPYLLALIIFGKALYRLIRCPGAHTMLLYARNVDQMQVLRISHDRPRSRRGKGRSRPASLIPFIIWGALLWQLWRLIGPPLGQLARRTGEIIWQAPWTTLLALAALGLATFWIEFARLRSARREAKAWPVGRFDHFLHPARQKPPFTGS
ncbi:MAG TPA: lipase family protein [Allosphingosinicella sp.]|nr:lipase family protein [Allosphingosinicella sp.]